MDKLMPKRLLTLI
jgi:hypothetical protein